MLDATYLRQTVVEPLLAQVGKDYTFKETINGEYNPETSEVTSTVTEYVFRAGVFNYVLKYSGGGMDLESAIRVDDRKVYVVPRADGKTPRAGTWSIVLADGEYKVITVKEHNPAGIPIMYECQVRKS